MALLRRTLAAAPAGILANRQQAHPALLRMLSRARRRAGGLTLVQVRDDGAGETGFQRFLAELAAELRIQDLAWQEAGGVVMILLEDTPGEPTAVLGRLERRARLAGARPAWRWARFPEQGLTLQALLEAVQWAC